MGATVLRVLKWLLLAWATASLLGLAALFGTLLWFDHQYEARAAEEAIGAEPTEQQQARQVVEQLWPGENAYVAFEGRHEFHSVSDGNLVVTAIRLRPGAVAGKDGLIPSGPEPSTWATGDRASPVAALALNQLGPRLHAPVPGWLPTPVQLHGATF